MAASHSLGSVLTCLLLLFNFVQSLNFDLFAHAGAEAGRQQRCIRNFVARDTLVVVTATVGGRKGDGQVINMHVCIRASHPRNRKLSLTTQFAD